jgi:Flp pilus assembly protein TadG
LRGWTQRRRSWRPAALGTGPTPERGQISILILGFTAVALMLVVGGVDVTAVQLARARLLDAADGAALDAADSLDEPGAYGRGFDDAVRLTDATVQQAAAAYLAAQPRPTGVSSWELLPGTGAPDSQTAVVRLQGQATIPVLASVVEAFGGSVTITVESRARAGLQ